MGLLNGSSFITNPDEVRWQSVCDLWLSNRLFWDKDKVINLYGPDVGNIICKLPIVKEGLVDKIVWLIIKVSTRLSQVILGSLCIRLAMGPIEISGVLSKS